MSCGIQCQNNVVAMSLSIFHVKGVSLYSLFLVSIVRRYLPFCLLLFFVALKGEVSPGHV